MNKLGSRIEPGRMFYCEQHTTSGGNAAEAITIAGVASTDKAFVELVDDGSNNVTISIVVCTANTVTVTFSGDPGGDAVINILVIK